MQTLQASDRGLLEEQFFTAPPASASSMECETLTFDSATASRGYNPLAGSPPPRPSKLNTAQEEEEAHGRGQEDGTGEGRQSDGGLLHGFEAEERTGVTGVNWVKHANAYAATW